MRPKRLCGPDHEVMLAVGSRISAGRTAVESVKSDGLTSGGHRPFRRSTCSRPMLLFPRGLPQSVGRLARTRWGCRPVP